MRAPFIFCPVCGQRYLPHVSHCDVDGTLLHAGGYQSERNTPRISSMRNLNAKYKNMGSSFSNSTTSPSSISSAASSPSTVARNNRSSSSSTTTPTTITTTSRSQASLLPELISPVVRTASEQRRKRNVFSARRRYGFNSLVSQQEEEELGQKEAQILFYAFDKDRDGHLSIAEMGSMLSDFGFGDKEVERFFLGLDLNENGKVSLDEFLGGHSTMSLLRKGHEAADPNIGLSKEVMKRMNDSNSQQLQRQQQKKINDDYERFTKDVWLREQERLRMKAADNMKMAREIENKRQQQERHRVEMKESLRAAAASQIYGRAEVGHASMMVLPATVNVKKKQATLIKEWRADDINFINISP